MLEPTESGFAVQVPDLAVITHGQTIEMAKKAAVEAISVNLEAYLEAGQEVPQPRSVEEHLRNPELKDLLFAYVDIEDFNEKMAA